MSITVRHLGISDFEATCLAMQRFTLNRTENTPDELWLTQHHAVYSLGLNRKNIRLPNTTDNTPRLTKSIPVVPTDRGGKITYHALGQVVIYVLLDLKRNNLNIRTLVSLLENTVVELLSNYQIVAFAKSDAPGVYVEDAAGQIAKIASLGLRIKNNCCYHGLSLNVDMDLSPFLAIDPCGYAGLKVTQTKDLGVAANAKELGRQLLAKLVEKLGNSQA